MYAKFDNFCDRSSRILSSLWSKKARKMSIWVVLMLTYIIPLCYWFTCSASTSISNTINSEQCSFSGYPSTFTFNAVYGPVSKSMYYMYSLH